MTRKIWIGILCTAIIAVPALFAVSEVFGLGCECTALPCDQVALEEGRCWQSNTTGYTVNVLPSFPQTALGNRIYEYQVTRGNDCERRMWYFEVPIDTCTGFCDSGLKKPTELLNVECLGCPTPWDWEVLYKGDLLTGYLKGDTNHCIVKVSLNVLKPFPAGGITVKLTLNSPNASVGKSHFSTQIKNILLGDYGRMLVPGCETSSPLTQRTFTFTLGEGGPAPQECTYKLDATGKFIESIKCNDAPVKYYPVSWFVYCVPDAETLTPADPPELEGYTCHQAVDVTDGCGFLGNAGICQKFIKPPGIFMNVTCP
jgi:hypothetical protein